MAKNFLFVILSLSVSFATAQNLQLIKEIAGKSDFITSDNFGNLYIINEFRLSKYDNNGHLIKVFEDYRNGSISYVDASDPLKIMLFYQDFLVVKVLDKTLSEISSYSLNDLGLMSVSAFAHSRDDNFWVFDNVNFRLNKVDENGENLYQSEKFNLLFEENVVPKQIIDYEQRIYLLDSHNGIYVFDRMGVFSKRIPLLKTNNIQVIKEQIIYAKDGVVYNYNPQTFEEKEMEIPAHNNLLNIQIQKDRLYVQELNGIFVYNFDN